MENVKSKVIFILIAQIVVLGSIISMYLLNAFELSRDVEIIMLILGLSASLSIGTTIRVLWKGNIK
ncbi:MAG: hypothetical protein LKJ83_09475 [Eubacteriaceae bacterium]|jgi:hypothetical protein|nr:hypothetical protein [Eubacteriaceae bacterium]